MSTVWKFTLSVTDVQKVTMPAGAELLFVGMQGSFLTLWARVVPEVRKVERLIAVVGTGNPAPDVDDGVYVGSVFDGPFVWHVFDGAEL